MQMLYVISQLLKRDWRFVGDDGFACIKLWHTCVKFRVSLVSHLRVDASLFEARLKIKSQKAPTVIIKPGSSI